MALRKNNYPIVVDGGLNTKTDEALASQGQALVLENAIFDEIGSIKKRCGFTNLNVTTNTGSLTHDLITNHNETIFVEDPINNQFKYFYTGSGWSNHPYGSGQNPERRHVYSSWMAFIDEKLTDKIKSFYPFMIECPDEDYRIVGYTTYDENLSSPTYQLKVFKSYKTHDRKIQLYTLSGSNNIKGLELRICPDNTNNLHVFYSVVSGANWQLKHIKVDITTTVAITTNLSTYPIATGTQGFSTINIGNNILIACDKTNTTTTNFTLINSSGTILDSDDVLLVNAHYGSEINCYSLCTNGNYVYSFFRNITVNGVTYIGIDTSGNAISIYKSETTISTSLKVLRIVSIYHSPASKIYVLFELYNSSNGFNNAVEYALVTPSSGASSTYSLYPAMNIASRLFKISGDYADKIYFIGQSGIPNRERYYLCTWNGSINGDFYVFGHFAINGEAGLIKKTISAGSMVDVYDNYNLPEICIGAETGEIFYPALYITRVLGVYSSLDNYNVASLFIVKLDYKSEYRGIYAKLGGSNHIAGSMCIEYDNRRFLEQNFLDSNFLVVSESASGSLANGTYQYTGIYEFIDNNGQVHRSAPFNIATVTTVAGKAVTVKQFYQDPQNYAPVWGAKEMNVIIYRTTAGGTIFYRLAGYRGAMLYGVNNYTFTDSMLDADLEDSTQLYTNGGILDSDPLPPTKYIMVANNRLFAISSEDENRIYFSQPYLEGEAVNFSGLLTLRGDAGLLNDSGKCIALGSLDDKIIIFKDNSIAYFYGDGPNQAGLQNNFSEPKLITSNVGIKDVKSIVAIPQGLMFKGTKGIYLLDRSLNLQYIGAPVEDYNSETVINAVGFSSKHIALFMTSSRTLAYDYLVEKWSVWTISGKSMCLYNGVPIYIDNNSEVMLYTEGLYLDDTDRYSLKIATTWIKLDGIQNFQRVYRIMLYGEYYSDHDLIVNVYYDYDNSDFDTYTLSPLNNDSIYQYEIHLKRQKCQALKIEVYDQSNSGSNQSFKLTNITAVIGKKEGTNKLEDSRRY